MKSFLQYITEDMPIVRRGVESRHYRPRKDEITQFGRVGSYKVFHVPDRFGGAGVFHIHHGGKQIGHIPYGTYDKQSLSMEGPNIVTSHRGRKARVRNLMPKLYAMIADKTGKKIVSDLQQSPGGQDIWRRLSKMREVHMRTSKYKSGEAPLMKGRYDPDKHETTIYHPRYGDNYTLVLHPRKKK